MQIVKDLTLNINSFDSKGNGLSEESKEPFKSIFEAKIDGKSQDYRRDSIQDENKIEDKLINISISVSDYSVFGSNKNWQDLLKEANIAEKEPDEDIEKAQSLMSRVDQYLYGNSAIQSKAFRVKKSELFSAINGLEKLALTTAQDKFSEKRSLQKTNSDNLEKNKEIDLQEKRKVVLQFKDAKVSFSPDKRQKTSDHEYYQVQVLARASEKFSGVDIEANQSNSSGHSSNGKINNDGSKSNNQISDASKDINSEGQPGPVNDFSSDAKKENSSKEQVLQLVKNKSELAGNILSEDKNLKIEFKSFAENLKTTNSEKVIKTNLESVSNLVENDEMVSGDIAKIMPSGNLEALFASQNGMLQVDGEVPASEMINTNNLNLASNNFAPAIQSDSILESGVTLLENKEVIQVNDKSLQTLGGGKGLHQSASASVLDRINQVAMIQKISNRIQVRQLKEFGIVNIQLDPPELGKLLLKLTVKGKDIKVSILTENSSAFELLKSHKQLFMQSMKENGLDITEFDVNTKDNSNASSFSQNNDHNEQFKNEKSSNIPMKIKEINYDNRPINFDSANLSDGYHISFIA